MNLPAATLKLITALVLALPAAAAAHATADVTMSAEAWNRFDSAIAGRLSSGNRAVGVAVSIDGQLAHAAAFGTRTGDPADPATVRDRFRLASISKLITATVVLQIVDRGDLGLDQPVGALLAGIVGVDPGDDAIPTITVRQLLSHTSGFPDYRRQFFGDQFDSCEQAAAFGLARPVAHRPGTTHDYSNLNFCLLGLLIAHTTGMTYEAAVTELLLRPLGISGMRLVATIDPHPDEVEHHSGPSRTYMESLGAAGAWVATPADIVRILDSLDPASPGWHPIPPELALLMPHPLDVAYPEPHERRYGLGMVVWPDGTFGHTGTVESTHTMLVRRPDGVTWCILVSGTRPDSTEQLRDIFDDAVASSGLTFG